MRDHIKNILLAVMFGIILLGIGLGFGFSMGVNQTIHYGIKIVQKLIEMKKIDFNIDYDMIEAGIFQYKNRIGECFFMENESLKGDLET